MESIPPPYYTLINTSRGSLPAVVVVNSALRAFTARSDFPGHLSIRIECQLLDDNGMPTGNENQELYMLEYALAAALKMQTNALFLARITCDGKQELSYRIRDPKAADSELKRLVLSHATRVWEYRTDNDPNWGLAKGELQLLLKDSKFTS